MNLYELTSTYEDLMRMLYNDEIEEQTIIDTLESIEYDIEEKAEGYAKIIKTLESDVDSIKTEKDRLNKRQKTIESKIDILKSNLESSMKITGKKNIKTALFSFNIQKNPPSVQIDDEELLIKETGMRFYTSQEPKLNKTYLAEALKSGEEYSFARLIQKESLRIK